MIPQLDTGPRSVGYARVSTVEQRLDLQIDALRKAGVRSDNMHVEKVSGASRKRPSLDMAIKDLRPGDTLLVWRLDRLARNMQELYKRLDMIHDAGAGFRSLTESFDFSTASGKFVLGILGLVAAFERQLTIERTKAGIQAARARGWSPGRAVSFTAEKQTQASELLKGGMTLRAVAATLGVSVSLLYQRGLRRHAR